MTGQPFARLSSWHPRQHCGVAIPPAIPTPSHRIHATVNGSGDGVPLGSADVILESAIGFGIVVCQNDWSPPCPNFSFAGGCDPFLGVDPLLPVLDPLPVFATAPALGLYHHTANAPRRPKSFDVSDPTLLPVQTFPPLWGAPYPHAVSTFSPSTSIPEKILWNCLVHAPPERSSDISLV